MPHAGAFGLNSIPGPTDVLIIGGGFFGCCLALYYRETGRQVVLVESSSELLTRASYVNQARVHNGYHYPRSLLTAIRSRINFPKFSEDFYDSVVSDFEKIYAIARTNSKVSAYQFQKFCENVGAPCDPVDKEVLSLFDSGLIEAAFRVQESAFDAVKLRDLLQTRMAAEDVQLYQGKSVKSVSQDAELLSVHFEDGDTVSATNVVLCTYSRINKILKDSDLPILPMKHEIAEVALIDPAPELSHFGITVMDGPFFSSMPFPAANAFSLTHVRYTPHESWLDTETLRDPYDYLARNTPATRYLYMVKDAQRYVPALERSKYLKSLYEVKTTLPQNEVDDGRPILYRPDYGIPGLSVVMGGKIDNIYDIIHAIQVHEGKSDNSPLAGAKLQDR